MEKNKHSREASRPQGTTILLDGRRPMQWRQWTGALRGRLAPPRSSLSVGVVVNGRVREQVSRRAPPCEARRAVHAVAGGRMEAQRESRWGRAAGPGIDVVREEGVRGARMRSLLLVSPSATAGVGGSCERRGADRDFARRR